MNVNKAREKLEYSVYIYCEKLIMKLFMNINVYSNRYGTNNYNMFY